MQDSAFLEQFENCTLPVAEFNHRNHVRAAWLFLRRESLLIAMAKFTSALKRFAAANGAAHIYNETITWAYLLLIHERIANREKFDSFDQFAEVNPDICAGKLSILKDYYNQETLFSDLAKQKFVLPDK